MGHFFSDNNRALLRLIRDENNLKVTPESFRDENVIIEFVLDKKRRGDFLMHYRPNSKGFKTLVCKICNNDKFTVGQDDYYTAIRCEHCGYELGIHEG